MKICPLKSSKFTPEKYDSHVYSWNIAEYDF